MLMLGAVDVIATRKPVRAPYCATSGADSLAGLVVWERVLKRTNSAGMRTSIRDVWIQGLSGRTDPVPVTSENSHYRKLTILMVVEIQIRAKTAS